MEVVVVNIEGQIVEGATVKYVDKLGVRHDKPSEADRCDAIADSPIEIIPRRLFQLRILACTTVKLTKSSNLLVSCFLKR
jgi:hypothetical protein